MQITALRFPVLFIAEDGWIEYMKTNAEVAKWTRVGVLKYQRRGVVVLDANDKAWKVTSIDSDPPMNMLRRFLAQTVYNPKVPVRIELEPIVVTPMKAVHEAFDRALAADDDVLTQNVSAEELKKRVRNAHSCQEIVSALKRTGAI